MMSINGAKSLTFAMSLYASVASAQSHEHDRWGVPAGAIVKIFDAFISGFDDDDDDDGDGIGDRWGVPEWVAYELKRVNVACVKTHERPGWTGDEALQRRQIGSSIDFASQTRQEVGARRPAKSAVGCTWTTPQENGWGTGGAVSAVGANF